MGCAGCGWPAASPGRWPMMKRGTSSPRAISSSRAAPARSLRCPSRSPTAWSSSWSPEGSGWPHRWPPRRTPSSRPPASHLAQRTSITLANWRGRDAEAVALIEARQQEVLRRGEGLWLAADDWGSAQRYNALGRYDDALAAAERAVKDPRGLGPVDLGAGGAHRGCRAQRPGGAGDWSARPNR